MQNKTKRVHQTRDEDKMNSCCFVISRSAVRVREVAFTKPGSVVVQTSAPDLQHRTPADREVERGDGAAGGFFATAEYRERPRSAVRREHRRIHGAGVTCENTVSAVESNPRALGMHLGGMEPPSLLCVDASDPHSVAGVVVDYLSTITVGKAPKTQRQDHLYSRRLLLPQRCPDGSVVPPLVAPDLPIDALGTPEVYWLHRALAVTPTLANRVLCFVSQVCDHAERLGYRPPQSNPTRAIRRYSERARTEFLTAEQRRAFIDACWSAAQRGDVTVSAACVCLLLMLAGLRLHEATDLRWSEVDLRAGVIRLLPREERPSQTNKSGDGLRPITDDVLDVLRTMPRWCEWVCPNPRTRAPYVDVRSAMSRICELAGLPPGLRRHAIRHSFGTALAEAEIPAPKIAAFMGHASVRSAETYIHLCNASSRRDAPRVAAAVRGERRTPS